MDLNERMSFDHVIGVNESGELIPVSGVYAPLLSPLTDEDGHEIADTDPDLHHQAEMCGWQLLTGWSGQYGYAGPGMHASEYIGAELADRILSTPGYWVAVVPEGENSAGTWYIAHREFPESES